MGVAESLEKLVRWIPGFSGYLDREGSRDADKVVRERLSATLEGYKRNLNEVKRRLVQRRELPPLAELDRLASTIDRLANRLRYAARGYHGAFDLTRVDRSVLERVAAFDASLFESCEAIAASIAPLRDHEGDPLPVQAVASALDRFEVALEERDQMLAGGARAGARGAPGGEG
ncbi:MAG: hypothetical protein QOD06_1584 [Candidatus Binatota bacterium]|jgi:hypothetical protein|nr:hypothetical protein [Candidatus Binatota bacterium]